MTAALQLNIEGTAPLVRLGDGIAGLLALVPGSVDLVLYDLPSGETTADFDDAPGRRYRCWDSDPRFGGRP